ncbi:MAG: HD-GYP domain-containing protein [Phycisphaerae bacterium]|nr:HD-GYP domain-containing protein [Phycisphaerae bacterium]
MASSACDLSQLDALACSDPARAFILASGMEVGQFGQIPPTFAPSCERACCNGGERGSAVGVCRLVEGLVTGQVPEAAQNPSRCDQGYLVGAFPGVNSSSSILLLRAIEGPSDCTESEQAAAQMRFAGKLWQHVEQLAQESQGLAMELINSYEQLNVIFDITKRGAEVQDVDQIKLFLLRKLAETLSCDWACTMSKGEVCDWWCGDGQSECEGTVGWLQKAHPEVLKEVSEEGRILVGSKSSGEGGGWSCSVMVGPLKGGDEIQDIVILGRRQSRGEFKSGDMRMLDSVLSHGGELVSNLRLMERLRTLSFEAVLTLVSAIDKKDSYTSGHSERVGVLCRLIGEQMGLSPTELQDLEWAGILHDVGKIGISDGILTKPRSLTDEEFDHVKQHPRMSYEVIEPLRSFGTVREAVLHHHETPDGKGYPDGLKGDEISVAARIIHTADTFDALTSDRSYRRGFSLRRALEIMRQDAGTKIDPDALVAFEKALELFREEHPRRYEEMFGHIKEDEA